MGMAITLQDYISELGIAYEVLTHPTRYTSSKIAQSAHIPGAGLAKGVLVQDEDGGYMLVVVPATSHVDFKRLQEFLDQPVEMAAESAIAKLFGDCDAGAVPPIGNPYGIDVLLDETLMNESEIYFEAGDHKDLIHVSGDDFHRLTRGAAYGAFSHPG